MSSLEYSLMAADNAPSILTVGQLESLFACCWARGASSIDELFVCACAVNDNVVVVVVVAVVVVVLLTKFGLSDKEL